MSGNGKKKNLLERTASLRPPDGGWGWMVVCGGALTHIFLISLLHIFTLLYKDRFIELEFTSTDITTIVSLNTSFGMILGVFNGPILKIFGYRKLALVGGTFYVVGNLCTGVASSYAGFIIYYGMLSSLGLVMSMASHSLAINTYFLKNRSKAFSYTMTLTGLGPIFMPILVSKLLFSYGLKWTVFILCGLTLHVYVGAFLLQPVKWHMRRNERENKFEDKKNKEENRIILSEINSHLDIPHCETMSLAKRFGTLNSHSWWSQDSLARPRTAEYAEGKANGEKPRKISVTFLDNDDYKNMMSSTLWMFENIELSGKAPKYASAESLSLQNNLESEKWVTGNQVTDTLKRKLPPEEKESVGSRKCVESGLLSRFIRFVKDIYDVDLLHDPYYINILLGLAVALFGEVIFSSMTPFIFRDLGFGTEDTAKFMSIIACSDLVFRLLAPYAAKMLKLNSKMMYLLALILLFLGRASMYLGSTFSSYVVISFGLGVGKGFRSVFWVLVIPEHVPLTKLPSASAFQSLITGIMILVSGPIIGAVIAIDNRYTNLILVSNSLTFFTIVLWSGEVFYLWYRKWRQNQDFGNS